MLKERYIYKGKKKDIYTNAKRKIYIQMLKESKKKDIYTKAKRKIYIQMLKERYIYKC